MKDGIARGATTGHRSAQNAPAGFFGCSVWGKAVVTLVFVFVAGCGGSSARPPIADSVYVEVLMDLALLQGRAIVRGNVPDTTTDSVFAAHGLSRADYDATADYYAARPDSYRVRLDEALDRLAEEKRPGFHR